MTTARQPAQRRPNDDLFISTHDGDVYLDRDVRQIMGMLISDTNSWALPPVKAAPLYEYVWPDQPPVKQKALFVYRHDPPPPGKSAMVMNRVLPAVSGMAERNEWESHKPLVQRVGQSKYLVAAISTIALLFFGWMSLEDSAEIRKAELQIEAERIAVQQPTFDGLPPVEEIREKIAEQQESEAQGLMTLEELQEFTLEEARRNRSTEDE